MPVKKQESSSPVQLPSPKTKKGNVTKAKTARKAKPKTYRCKGKSKKEVNGRFPRCKAKIKAPKEYCSRHADQA